MIKPDPAIIIEINALDPAVIRAQRMAELEALAKVRAEKIQKLIDWSDPEKRALLQAQLEDGQKDARREVADKHEEFARMFDIEDKKPMNLGRVITPTKKKPWYKRILKRSNK
jgi:hypothetical protein